MCILRIVTRIMVRTYNCSCNRNMYLWWCSNVKRLQSFIWRYFYCAFLGFCLGIDSNVQPGVGKFGWIWLEWFARGQGIWLPIFEKSQIPTPCPASPSPAGITLIGALLVLIYSKLHSKSLPILIVLLFTWFTTIGKKAQTILTQHLFYIYVLVILKHFSAWFLHKLVVNYNIAHIKCPCTLPKFSCAHTNL